MEGSYCRVFSASAGLPMVKIEGTVERITFRNEENFYTVFKVITDTGDQITCVGTLPQVIVGEELKLSGEWTKHEQYGLQFNVESAIPITPSTIVGIERYLGSGLIKGVGPSTAKKLVDTFGLKTLEIIEKEPHRLMEVEGIGQKKCETIAQAFLAQKDIQDVMVFLQGSGITPAYAVRIYKEYGKQSIDVVRENPYRLADEIFGIGFKTADSIAKNLGIKEDEPHRIRAGIRYALSTAVEQGHTYLPQEELLVSANELLGITVEKSFLEELAKAKQLIIEEDRCYLPSLYEAECRVAQRLLELCEHVPTLPFDQEVDSPFKLAKEQEMAVKAAMQEKVLVITGGPGTGKTTITKVILAQWEKAGFKILLASPTGRAAKKLSEATGRPAKTIHRLLEYGFGQTGMGFQRDEDNKLKGDALVLDEFSMVDIRLMDSLLKATDDKMRLLFIGDCDQLPAVGPGNVLKDIIDSQKIPVVRLTKVFRQKEQSQIILNAHRINQGQFPIIDNHGDFVFMQRKEPAEIADLIVDLASERLPRYIEDHFKIENTFDTIQVLSPMRKSETGVDNLNKRLQERINPPGHKNEIRYGYRLLRENDKVMQIRNNYQKNVYNGDIGKILRIDPEDKLMEVLYNDEDGDRIVVYEEDEIDELTLAYAISVHKSQGSEYPVVIMPVTTQHYMLLQRNLLYTGVTRAKKLVVLIGTKRAIYICLNNNKTAKRYSYLAERLHLQSAL